jgi:hypothetical protein
MVYLPPLPPYHFVNPACPNSQLSDRFTDTKLTPFSTNCVEYIPHFVQGVVIELNIGFGWAIKDTFINASDFIPPALNPTRRIVHNDFIDLRQILCHLLQVSSVEGVIEFGQGFSEMLPKPVYFPCL